MSASQEFIHGIRDALAIEGFPQGKISALRPPPEHPHWHLSYTLTYGTKFACMLYAFLYDGVGSEMYFQRKFDRVKDYQAHVEQ